MNQSFKSAARCISQELDEKIVIFLFHIILHQKEPDWYGLHYHSSLIIRIDLVIKNRYSIIFAVQICISNFLVKALSEFLKRVDLGTTSLAFINKTDFIFS